MKILKFLFAGLFLISILSACHRDMCPGVGDAGEEKTEDVKRA
jgi:hypothetical protein